MTAPDGHPQAALASFCFSYPDHGPGYFTIGGPHHTSFVFCEPTKEFLRLRSLGLNAKYPHCRAIIIIVLEHVPKDRFAQICLRWRFIRKRRLSEYRSNNEKM